MDLNELVNLIKDTGVTIGILIYFCWRDCKYMRKIEETLDILKSYIMTKTTGDKPVFCKGE